MRIAIHSDQSRERPHIHGHILWAVFALMVLVLLFSKVVTGENVWALLR